MKESCLTEETRRLEIEKQTSKFHRDVGSYQQVLQRLELLILASRSLFQQVEMVWNRDGDCPAACCAEGHKHEKRHTRQEPLCG